MAVFAPLEHGGNGEGVKGSPLASTQTLQISGAVLWVLRMLAHETNSNDSTHFNQVQALTPASNGVGLYDEICPLM